MGEYTGQEERGVERSKRDVGKCKEGWSRVKKTRCGGKMGGAEEKRHGAEEKGVVQS